MIRFAAGRVANRSRHFPTTVRGKRIARGDLFFQGGGTVNFMDTDQTRQEIDPKSPHVQTALAMAALAVAFAHTLQELAPRAEALATLQRKVQVVQAKLRQTPGAAEAAAIFGFVRDALRNQT